MDKKEIKSILRHALLNIFTILNIITNNTSISKKESLRALSLIKIASLLVEYENIYLGKKIKFNKSKVNIKDVLDLLYAIFKKEITSKKIKFSLQISDFYTNCDKKRIQESIELIIKRIIYCSQCLSIKCSNSKKELRFKYDCVNCCVNCSPLKEEELISTIQNRLYENHETGFQLALRILHEMGIKTTTKKGEITLHFK